MFVSYVFTISVFTTIVKTPFSFRYNARLSEGFALETLAELESGAGGRESETGTVTRGAAVLAGAF